MSALDVIGAALDSYVAEAVASARAEERAAAEAAAAEVKAEHDAQIAEADRMFDLVLMERNEARQELADHMATHPVPPPPDPDPEPEPEPQPVANVLMGMSTDDYAARVAETGPIEAHRLFVPSFSVSSLVSKLEEANRRGVVPYWSLKFNSTWQAAASGADDALFRQLGNALASLPFPTFGSFHHEPRPASLAELAVWAAANVRVMGIVRPLAGPRHKLGTTDNGFPWSNKWGKLTDAELAQYYTPALLQTVDFLGGDFYDGATDTSTGEPAYLKFRNFRAWANRVAPTKQLAVGEWNAVTAEDIRLGGAELINNPKWAIACLFNSAENNRDDLPSSLGGSWVLRGDRLAAFREVLAQAR